MLLKVVLTLTLLLTPYSVSAEEQQPQAAAEMPGCPGKADGSPCCATCQDRKAQGISAEKAGGCPCQRAKKAREAARAAAAEQKQQN